MEAVGLTKNQIIEVLTRSPHGKLEAFGPVALAAAKAEPEFLAHLIAWNAEHGAIRDSKVALPVYSLAVPSFPGDLAENSFAHLALLDPRNFVRALDHMRAVGGQGRGRSLRRLVERYLRHREASFGLWERAVIQHRASIKTLYARWHVKPPALADRTLFKNDPPAGSTLDVIRRLKDMESKEALGHVLQRKIPFLVAVGALGPKLKDSDVVLALINSMSATELTTNAKMLERLGVKTNPALRAAFSAGLQKAVETAPVESLLKASKAAAAVGGQMGRQLQAAQEKQLKTHGGVKGRWLVLGDKSASMRESIEVTRFVASHLSRMAEEVHLVFFDAQPRYAKVTGYTLKQIEELSRHVQAGGGTNCLVGLDYLGAKGIEIDGVALISDGGHNYPHTLEKQWKDYCTRFAKEPTLYFFKVRGQDGDHFSPAMQRAGIEFELFDLRAGVDYYSLPNVIATMNTRRWSLLDQIMETPLKTLDEVFTHKGV